MSYFAIDSHIANELKEARELMLRLPPPEDANAIQVGLMRIQKAVIEDTISMKKAGLLLYPMQLALTNVGQTTFGKAKDEEMVRATVDEEVAFSEHQKPFTAKDAEDAKENQGLPLMNTDGTDFGKAGREDRPLNAQNQNLFTTGGTEGTEAEKGLSRMDADEPGLRTVEWKPMPDMYRMDTPEGRAAYEARFGMKIEPSGSLDHLETGTTPRAAGFPQ